MEFLLVWCKAIGEFVFDIWATMSSSFMFILPFMSYLLWAYLWFLAYLGLAKSLLSNWLKLAADIFSFLLSYKFIFLIFGQLI